MCYNLRIVRVLYAVSREITYPRNDVILRAFCRFAQVDVLGSLQRPRSLLAQSLKLAARGAPAVISGRYDLVFVGFYGHLMMLPFGILARRPVLFDAFVSTYDTLSEDRKAFSSRSFRGKLAFGLDRCACRLAERVLLDTELHCEYFAHTFGLPRNVFNTLPVGCNEDLFYPRPGSLTGPVASLLYYSSYMPLHGVDVVVRAAALLRAEALRFRLIGDGPMFGQVQELAHQLRLENLEFLAPVPVDALPDEIAAADICLGGHFGESDKAGRVVPGKIYQVLAMQRPLIATSTPANLELLRHGESAYLCPPGDAEALAAAILDLVRDETIRQGIAVGGRNLYLERCSEAFITERLQRIVLELSG